MMNQFYSQVLDKPLDCWIREDGLIMVDKYHMEDGKFTGKYRILPNDNDAKMWQIDYTKLVFDNFSEAEKVAENLKFD